MRWYWSPLFTWALAALALGAALFMEEVSAVTWIHYSLAHLTAMVTALTLHIRMRAENTGAKGRHERD